MSRTGTFLVVAVLASIGCLVRSESPPVTKSVVDLDEETWPKMLDGEWMVEFYAPWCPACKALQTTWQSFAEWAPDLNVHVAKVDVTRSPGLSGRFMVTALPTIYHVVAGQFRQYKGSRDREAFMSFVEEKKWQDIDPVPGWKAPDSVQMTVVASFFKLSQILRATHSKLMDEYGLPNWASYLIFAVSTIILGAILGLVLVCMIDYFFPQKTNVYQLRAEDLVDKKSDRDSGDEDDEVDDLLDDTAKKSADEDSSDAEKNSHSEEEQEEDGGQDGEGKAEKEGEKEAAGDTSAEKGEADAGTKGEGVKKRRPRVE